MKNILKALIICIILISLSGFRVLKKEAYSVEILQNGKKVKIVDNIITLEKKEFQLRITLKNLKGVFMNASIHRNCFDLKAEDNIPYYSELGANVYAESKFNTDREIILGDQGFSYFFYDKDVNWYRFDQDLKKKGKKIIGTRTVKTLHFADSPESKKIIVEDAEEEIFLFFFLKEDSDNDTLSDGIERTRIHIKWK